MREIHKKKKQISTSMMAVVALMTAVICVLAPFSISIGLIPISLATFGVYLTIIILGGKKATIVCLLYLLIGFVGLPVYSGFTGGLPKLFGPTGGYLWGYLLLTVIGGWFVDKFPGKREMCLLGLILGTMACYIVGTFWLAVQMKLDIVTAFTIGVVPFLIGDAVKLVVAVLCGEEIRKAIARAGVNV